jgi:hypothetical protein
LIAYRPRIAPDTQKNFQFNRFFHAPHASPPDPRATLPARFFDGEAAWEMLYLKGRFRRAA